MDRNFHVNVLRFVVIATIIPCHLWVVIGGCDKWTLGAVPAKSKKLLIDGGTYETQS